MTDKAKALVERLRKDAKYWEEMDPYQAGNYSRSADRIDQLTAEVERLREALTRLYPSNLAKVPDHLADDFVFPLDVTAGELRAASHALGDKQ